MKKKRLKANLKDLIHFLKHVQIEENQEETFDPDSVFHETDEEHVLDAGSGPDLETTPSSSLIRSWQQLYGYESD